MSDQFKKQLMEYLNYQINEGNAVRKSVREQRGIDTISGAIQAFEEVKEWVEEFEEDHE